MYALSEKLSYNEILAKHRKDCIVINGAQAIELPEPYIDRHGQERIPSVYFHIYHKQLPLPFVIYARKSQMSSCTPSDQRSYTKKYQRYTAVSFGYKVVFLWRRSYW